MKKHLFFVFILIALLSLALVSCGGGGDKTSEEGAGEKPEEGKEDGYVYSKDSELYFITGEGESAALGSNIASALDGERSVIVKFDSATSSSHKHEIVFGNTERAISRTAIQKLGRIDKNTEDELAFLIYSDGESIAIVYEDDGEGVMARRAAEYFIENYVKSELSLTKGHTYSEKLDLLEDYYAPLDEKYISDKWNEFERVAGKELTDAFKSLYALYSSDMIVWLANLYEPDICVCKGLYGLEECEGTKYCGTGGFYYSNSARDTIGYLPDAESTNQALNFLASSGLGYLYNDRYSEFLPEEMLSDIGDFIISLQEPNGYFYHPQWGIEFTDTKISRRARDLNWSVAILSNLGRRPLYTTPTGFGGTESVSAYEKGLVGRLGESRVTAVSSVIALNTDSYAPELQDLDSFKAYLAGLNIREESYFVGNELTSQANQILERDRQLGGTALMDYLIEWLNENQNPETGHWDYKKPGDEGYDAYYGVNGLLKISGIYTSAKKVIPNAKAAARSAMVAITDLQQIDAGVDLYNTWFAIRNIIENLRKFGGAEGNLMADEIVFELREDASGAVIVSRDKIKDFIKPDGSASYSREFSAAYSQGCPAAVPNSREGDVNGNVIASIGIITYALGALELLNYRVPLFGDVERRIFLDTIENLSPVNKVEDVTVPDPIDFDYDTTGEPSEDIILKLGDGSANVIDDPRGSGKVTAIVSPSGKGDAIRIANNTTSALATTSVFEGDFCLVGSDVEYSVQVYMDALYMFIFRVKGDEVHIHEVSSSTSANGNEEDLGIVAKVGEWFSIKVEHYAGDHSSVRIKVFADTDLSDGKDLTLYAVSDNYYDASGTKFLKPEGGKPSKTYTHTEIYVMAKPSVTMYVDNLNSYKSKTPYTEVIDPNGQPFFNVDAPDRAEKLYSFDDGVLPSELILESSADTVAVKDSMLALGIGSGESAVSLPINVRTKASRCAKVSFDIICPDAAVGKSLLSVFYRDGGERMLGLELAVKLEGAEKFVGIKTLGKESGDFLPDVRIDIGKKTNVRIEYFHAEDIALIYIDGVFVASGANIYEGAYKMTSDRVEFFSSGANLVSLDNITFEKVNRSFTDAVLPTIPSKVYDFESTHSELKTVGTGVKYSGGALEMNSERASVSLDVPINKRAPIYTSILFEATLSYSSLKNDGTLSLISFKDKDGNAVASLALRKNGSKVELCEVGADGPLPLALLSYGISEKIKLTLELFPKEKMIHIYENGAVVAKTSIFVGIDNLDAEIITASVQSGEESSVLRLDDLKFERLYSIYSNKSVTTKGNEEKTLSEPVTFEYSNSGNLPSVVTWGLAGSASAIRVERFEDKDGKQTNALSFYTAPGSNDMLVYTASEPLDSYKCVAFEADIMLDIRTEGQTTCYQMYFSSKDSRDKVYFLQLYKDGESFSLIDKSDTNNNSETKTDTLKTGIPHREWFKLRIEYYRGDANTVSFKIYLDGELCCESDNFFGSQVSSASPASRVECFYFYSLNKCDGTVYMDNVRLYGIKEN